MLWHMKVQSSEPRGESSPCRLPGEEMVIILGFSSDAPSLPRPSLQSSSAKTVGRTHSRWVFPESSLKTETETTLIFLIWSIFGRWRPKSLFLHQNRYVLEPKRGILRWLPACPAHNTTAATEPTLLIVTLGPNEASEILKPAIINTWGSTGCKNEPNERCNIDDILTKKRLSSRWLPARPAHNMAVATKPTLLIAPYGLYEATETLKPAIAYTWGASGGRNEPEGNTWIASCYLPASRGLPATVRGPPSTYHGAHHRTDASDTSLWSQ